MNTVDTIQSPDPCVCPLHDDRQALINIAPEQAAFFQQFFQQRRHCETQTKQGMAHWQFSPARHTGSDWVELECGERRILITVTSRQNPSGGLRPFWDYQGESRLIAWILEHDALLDQLNDLFQANWQPCAMYQWHSTQPSLVLLAWQMRHADHTWTGSLVQSLSHARQWMHAAHWQTPSIPPNAIAIAVPLRMPLATMSSVELGEFEIGDVLVAGKLSSCWQALQLSQLDGAPHSSGWHCHLTSSAESDNWPLSCPQQTLSILSALRETPMTTDTHVATEPLESEALPAQHALCTAQLSQLPLTVYLELAELRLPAQALLHLQPGYLIELDQPIAEQRVAVKVQNQHWASGELVRVGDRLGIRILDIASHGSEQP